MSVAITVTNEPVGNEKHDSGRRGNNPTNQCLLVLGPVVVVVVVGIVE